MNAQLRRVFAGVSLAATAWLAACGGGGSDASTAAPAAQYEGTISGFGSVIVNGVRFDDSRAAVTIDDASAAKGALKLGMRVTLSGSVAEGSDTGTATHVNVETAVRGQVASVDLANANFKVRGITIQTDTKTVFEGASELAALKAGDWVEVHGSVDFTNRVVQATRVEVKAPQDIGRVVLFGKATGVTATTFTLGDLTVNYASAQLIGFDANGIAEGAVVRVRSNQPPLANVLTATFVKAVKAPRLLDGTPAAVEGRIQQFNGAADFLVSGTAVDASNATFENGVIADLAEGKRVIVRGTLANGKVIAKKVRFFLPDQDGEIRLIGLVSDYLTNASFKVRGVAVDASSAQFINGDAAELSNSRLVQIKGQAVGSLVTATSVQFLDSNAVLALLTGKVSDANSLADFKVGGQAAKVGLVVRFINGNAASIVNGATLWMKGHRDANGTFVANIIFVVPNWIVATTQAAGIVTNPDTVNGTFKLNGTTVTTSPATAFVGGTAVDLEAGGWVIVTGKMNTGVLAAETIVITRDTSTCKAFKLEAVIYDYVSVSDFKLFGFSVDASRASFSGGTAADLADGKVVQACGDELPVGDALKANSIEFRSAP